MEKIRKITDGKITVFQMIYSYEKDYIQCFLITMNSYLSPKQQVVWI